MPESSTRENYTNIVHEAPVDGGWSGKLRIVVGTSHDQQDQPFVFVDSVLGPRRLVLTADQAGDLADELAAAGAAASLLEPEANR